MTMRRARSVTEALPERTTGMRDSTDGAMPVLRGDDVGLTGSGWCCRSCHPDPNAASDLAHSVSPAPAHPLFAAARAKGFRSVSLAPLHPGVSVIGTAEGWLRFTTTATPEELAAAAEGLARFVPKARK
jgi:hypothetical protein